MHISKLFQNDRRRDRRRKRQRHREGIKKKERMNKLITGLQRPVNHTQTVTPGRKTIDRKTNEISK